MTFDEDKVNRAKAGTFDNKTQSGPEFTLGGAGNLFESMTLARMVEATGPDFWVKAAESENAPPALLRALADSDNDDLRLAVAANHSIDTETRDLLSSDENASVRASLIYGPTVDESFLDRFENDDDFDVVYALCQKTTSAARLQKLHDIDYAPEYEIAGNPAVSAEMLAAFSMHEKDIVRSSALDNPNVTAEAVNAAATDGTSAVRVIVARHRLATVETLRMLVTDPEYTVRLFVAGNGRTDVTDILRLSQDEDQRVRRLASRVLVNRHLR